jgi:quercetin dioxygenase-like cupin family protein
MEWSPLPLEGCRNVDAKVLVSQNELTVAMLRFSAAATIHEHEADHETEVVCLEGSGFTSIDGIAAPIKAGETVHWPRGHPHRLWTEDVPMLALMIEHPPPYRP